MSHAVIQRDRFLIPDHEEPTAEERQEKQASSWLRRFVEALMKALSVWTG